MALADFNQDNPFIIIMKDRAKDLENKCAKTISDMIIGIIIAIILILLSIFTIPDMRAYIIFLIIFGEAIDILNVYTILKSSELAEVNNIIYGSEYAVITINNEHVLSVIEKIDYVRGELNHSKKYNALIIGTSCCYYLYFLLLKFIK